jgi:hypothetical protein
LKKFKSLSIALLLVTFLASCNLPKSTEVNGKRLIGTVVALTLQVQSTQTQYVVTPLYTAPATASPVPTISPPNTPVWSIYNYTCELASGGSTMTMNLGWTDRSNGEESYKVYRDEQLIAVLPPNSTTYVDIAFIAMGKTLSYSVEAFNNNWQASTSTITHGCQ